MLDKFFANRWLQTLLLLALLCTAVGFSFSHARWREQMRNFTFDNYNILKPRVASENIVIIDIDETSLAKVGQMPWPRDVMADLVKKLKDMGAAVIVFDIVFPEPDRSSPHAIIEHFKDTEGFEPVINRLTMLPDNDALFGQAIAQAGNVVTGFSFTNEITGTSPTQKGMFRGKDIEKFIPNMAGASSNLKVIAKDAAGNGSFFVSTDTDGIIRRVPMLVAHRKPDSSIVTVFPSLALEAIRVLDGERGGLVVLADPKYAGLDPSRFGVQGIEIGKGQRFIPTNAHGEFLVYFAKSDPAWYVPAYHVLDQTLTPEKVKDKIVLIGTSAVGLKDIRSTPLNTFIPGVEVHLNILDQILQGKFLSRSIEAEGLEAVSIFLMGLFIILCASFIGAVSQALIVAFVITASVYAGWYAFSAYGMLIDVAYPSLSILAIFMLSTVLTYLRTESERRAVRQAFGLYISPAFMQELTNNPEKLKLGGESRELTIMFTDIRKFTSISEGLNPEELIHLMNDFLTPMSDLVMENRGTIDKYMGDAMMAFWNAPLDDPDHARHACRAALGMQAALEPINQQLIAKAHAGKTPLLLKAGIGINTGPASVGNMGSRQRFAYSALGDSVNLASRIEGQTKTYEVPILIGQSTRNMAPEFATIEVDILRVQGRIEPVRVYALIGDSEMAQSVPFKLWQSAHEKMIADFRARDFEGAFKKAQDCIDEHGAKLQGLYNIYKDRSVMMMKNPPPKDWDAVFDAIGK